MPGNSHFQPKWVEITEYKQWLQRGSSSGKAKCTMCAKEIDISNMGESALKSHLKSTRHKELCKTQSNLSINDWVRTAQVSTSKEPSTPVHNLEDSLCSADVLKAEIYWALNAVKSHFS